MKPNHTLPAAGPLGAALRSMSYLDRELITYCETGHLDALERARGAATSALANIDKELNAPSLKPQKGAFK